MKKSLVFSLRKPLLAGLLAGFSLVACGRAPLPLSAQMAPYGSISAPQMQAMRAPTLQAQSAQTGIQVSFVKAYSRNTAQNELITRQDPNSPSAMLIRLIDSARKTLDGSFYDIDSKEVVDALIRAQRRRVRVRLVTDTDNLTAKGSGPQGPPRVAITELKKAGIPIVDDQRSGIMHNKFLVVDGQTVWTGSTNLTDSSLYNHNNNALSLQSTQLAASYSAEFERLFTQRIFGPNPARVSPPSRVKMGSATVDVYFSPRGGGQEAVLRELSSAKKRILFMTFSLTDKSAGDIIMAKQQQGVQIAGVFDSWLGASRYTLFNPLKDEGMDVRKDGNQALLHHKVIIVDDTVITGSYNYSNNAENSNNENFLIIRNAPAVTQAYIQEFERVRAVSKPGVVREDYNQ
jgi:phosphatidylserine/phosphatidylglycerophosphate/cardiolipin synthase-like enzyme